MDRAKKISKRRERREQREDERGRETELGEGKVREKRR